MQPEDSALISALDRLSARLAQQTEGIDELHTSILAEANARERKVRQLQRVVLVCALALMLIIAGVAGTGILIRQQNNEAKQRATAAQAQRTQQQATADLLKDCVTPGGACFNENQVRTGQALQQLQRFEYVVGYCSASYPNSPTEYKSCVLSFKVPGAPTDLPTPSK